jgi:hypothetical protein
MSQNKAEFCHSHCPHIHLEKVNKSSAVLHCKVIPQTISLVPEHDDAQGLFDDIKENAHIVFPFACQAVTPTLLGSPTIELYKRK